MKLSLIMPYLKHITLTPRQVAAYNRMIRQGTSYAQRLTAQERAILIRLLREEEMLPGMAHVIADKIQATKAAESLPSLLFAVLAPDWAGLADACLGTVHETGMNIAYTHGFILRRGRERLGVVLMEVEIAPHLTRAALDIARAKIHQRLSRIAAEDEAKKALQQQEARRLFAFTAVTDILRPKLPPEDLKEIMGDSGEALKFFIARQESYINQRPVEAIADQILGNYRMKQMIRSGGSAIEVGIQTIPCRDRNYTGLTVASRDTGLTFERLLRTLEELHPGHRRYGDYAYFTADKISVFHLELTAGDDQPVPPDQWPALAEAVRKIPEQKETLGPTPGVELIRRKIVPLMVDEEKEIKIPQGYIHPHAPDHFKVIVVASGIDSGFGLPMVQALSQVPGFSAAMPDLPSRMSYVQNGTEYVQEISIADVWIDRKLLSGADRGRWNDEDIYNRIESALKTIPGFGPKLRIFDRTTRAMRQVRLRAVAELAGQSHIDPEQIKPLFYRLGDRCLLSPGVTDQAVFDQVKLEHQTFCGLTDPAAVSVQAREIRYAEDSPGFTAVAVAFRKDQARLDRAFEAVKPYEVNGVCRTDYGDAVILLFNLTRNGLPLEAKILEQLMRALQKM